MFFMYFLRSYTDLPTATKAFSANDVVYNERVGNYYRNKQEGGL